MRSGRKQMRFAWRAGVGVVFLGALLMGWRLGRVPVAVVGGYTVMSVMALLLYGRDKRAARAGARRTRERTLHLVDLLGGWPGGLIGQDLFRHKTRKTGFQIVFWATVVLHCTALAIYLRATGVHGGAARAVSSAALRLTKSG